MTNRVLAVIILVLLLVLSFSEKIIQLFDLNIFTGFRQILLIITVFLLTLFSPKISYEHKKFKFYMLFFFLLTLLNFLLHPVNLIKYSYGFFSTTLFAFIFIFSSKILLSKKNILLILKYLLFFYLSSVFISLSSIAFTLDLRTQFTFFRELGAYGTASVFGIIISLSLNLLTKNKIYLLFCCIFLIAVFSTVLKKSIIDAVLVVIIFIFFRFKTVLRIYYTLILAVLILFFMFFVGNDLVDNINMNIEYYNVTKDEGVRQIMYISALYLATSNFPFGSGIGTFASPASIVNGYSDTYYQTGISNIAEMSPELVMGGNPHTLFDTYWPHILGETGFIGSVIFLFMWLYPYKYISTLIKENNFKHLDHVLFFVISSTVVLSLDGFTLYLPELPLFIALHIMLSILYFNAFYTNNKKP